ncbi:unannotated protein [freshwater metagenome]|uniref:Unannotated protein n=1 Tax=freshwater metagenome TaxID=449393 RepID=A0A6J7MXH1_9ZZZZ
MAKVFAHFDRSGCAVNADDVWMKRIDRGEGRSDLRAGQHAAGEFHRDLHLKGDFATLCSHRSARTVHGGLHGEEVEHGFDDEEVDTAFDQCPCLRFVVVSEFGIANLAE